MRAAVVAGAALLWIPPASAEFVLNWSQGTQSNPAFNTLGCDTPNLCAVWHDNDGNPAYTLGQTPFYYGIATLDGNNYYHMIIGDPEGGFAQEVFIRMGVGLIFPIEAQELAFEPAEQGIPFNCPPAGGPCANISEGPLSSFSSSSRGAGADGFGEGNGMSPLNPNALFSGNASGNPERVQMRQLVRDGDLTSDFLKDRFLDKPNITNTIETGDIRVHFFMDSTGNRYNTLNTPSAVTNTVEHLNPSVPEGSALFDMATDAQNLHLTAGRYTYTQPNVSANENLIYGGSGGTYQYVGGGISQNPNWDAFFDHREANPWSFPADRPTP